MSSNLMVRKLSLKQPTRPVTLMTVRCFQKKNNNPKAKNENTVIDRHYKVPAHRIGVIKSWDSRHTGGLKGSLWAHDRFMDDVMIRKFIEGTFYDVVASDVIVKRRLNQIIICLFVNGRGENAVKVYFLKAFAEKVLTELLGCLVMLEIRSGRDER